MEAFELRLWDSRIGRWLTTDPYGQYHSPYLGMGNDPINGIDPDGGWKTKWGQFWGWVGNGFSGERFTSESATGKHKYGLAFDYGGGPGEGDLTGTFMAVIGADLDSWNSNQEWGDWRFTEYGMGFEVDMMKAYEPNLWGRADNWMNDNKVVSYATGARILYNIADDAYVYGTRNFTTSGSRHLNRMGATPKEQFDSGFNTFTTFFPTPLKGFRVTGARYNVATFGSAFKGTFLTKLKPSTRGLIIRYTNKATDQIHGKRILNTTKSVGESIKGD